MRGVSSLALLFAMACALKAQMPVSLEFTSSSDAAGVIAAKWKCSGSCGELTYLSYWAGDPATSTHYRTHAVKGNPSGWYQDFIVGAEPGDRFLVLPVIENATGSAYSGIEDAQNLCPGGTPSHASYDCEAVAGGLYIPAVIVPGSAQGFSQSPIPPQGVPSDYDILNPPIRNGLLFTTDNSCSDLASLLADCAAYADDHPGTVSVVEIPAGAHCSAPDRPAAPFIAPSITYGARCILRSDAEARFLPPPGSPIGPFYPHGTAVLRGSSRYATGTANPILTVGDNWTVGPGLHIRPPNPDEIMQDRIVVTGVSGDTLAAPGHGLRNGELVNVYLSGIREADWQEGQCLVASATANTFRCFGASPPTGTFAGGYVTTSPIRTITSCSSSGVCAVPGHPYTNRVSESVSSWSGTQLTFATDVTKVYRRLSSIKLTGMAGCGDTIVGIAAVAGNVVTTNRPSPASCTGGLARMLHLVDIEGTSSQAADGAYLVSWGPDTMTIEQPAWPGINTAGYVAHDPPQIKSPLLQGSGSSRSFIDRVWIGGGALGGWPHQILVGVSLSGSRDAAVAGVYDSNLTACMPLDPNMGVVSRTFTGFSVIHTAIANTGAQRIKLLNNKMSSGGFFVFADNSAILNDTSDLAVDGIELSTPTDARSPNSKRRGCNMRQSLEQKAYRRGSVINFAILGTIAANVPDGSGLYFLASPGSNTSETPQQDLRISNGWIVAATGITISESLLFKRLRSAPRRIEVSNVHVSVRRDLYMSHISGQNLELPSAPNQFYGPGIRISAPVTSLVVRNTSLLGQGIGPYALWLPRRGKGWTIENNILMASFDGPDSNGFMKSIDTAWTDAVPPSSTQIPGWESWREMTTTATGGRDTTSRFDNKVVACTMHANDYDWYWKPGGSTRTTAESQLNACSPSGCVNFGFEVSGQDGLSCADNLDGVFELGSWRRRVAVWAGNGPDWDSIAAGLGRFSAHVEPYPGALGIEMTVPRSDRVCHAQLFDSVKAVGSHVVPDLSTARDWVSTGLGGGTQTVVLSGVAPGVTTYWSAVCGLYRVWGSGQSMSF